MDRHSAFNRTVEARRDELLSIFMNWEDPQGEETPGQFKVVKRSLVEQCRARASLMSIHSVEVNNSPRVADV